MTRPDKEELLRYIFTTSFSIDDIKLYLDTHPTDKQALEYYEKVSEVRKRAIDEYTQHFGPLTADKVNAMNRWTWIDGPWPWEV